MKQPQPAAANAWPDPLRVTLGPADWNSAPVFYPELRRPSQTVQIGKVYRIHGRTWNNGRDGFWSNSYGDFCYTAEQAAVALATHYVRLRKVPRYL